MITAEDVTVIIDALHRAGLDVWIGGGWGIDALIGRQTRDHRDLDLMHRQEQEPRLLSTLAELGYRETLDLRPVRFVLADPAGRELDLHPLRFAPDGSAVQSSPDPERPFVYPADCFVTGVIGGSTVGCLSAQRQNDFHRGYAPTGRDRHDMALLRRHFGIDTYFP